MRASIPILTTTTGPPNPPNPHPPLSNHHTQPQAPQPPSPPAGPSLPSRWRGPSCSSSATRRGPSAVCVCPWTGLAGLLRSSSFRLWLWLCFLRERILVFLEGFCGRGGLCGFGFFFELLCGGYFLSLGHLFVFVVGHGLHCTESWLSGPVFLYLSRSICLPASRAWDFRKSKPVFLHPLTIPPPAVQKRPRIKCLCQLLLTADSPPRQPPPHLHADQRTPP